MGYNITTFKLKELHNLVIPVKAIFNKETAKKADVSQDFIPEKLHINPYDLSSVEIDDILMLEGKLNNDLINVSKISYSGDGSGHFHEFFKEVFKESTGYLEAVLIWEGGDSVYKLVVDSGVVTEQEIEL